MLFNRPNYLILDEPTNHLDVETVEALGKALGAFKVCRPPQRKAGHVLHVCLLGRSGVSVT